MRKTNNLNKNKGEIMKKKILTMLLATVCISLNWHLSAADKEQKKAPTSFKEFFEHLDLTKNTSLHVKHYWKKNRGKTFTWTGKVVNVKGKRGKAEICVANSEAPTYKGFNLILISYQIDNAAALKIGQEIKFKGQVYNYKGKHGKPIIVYVNNVEILP